MAETFTRWDPLNYLKTDDDFRLYLEACAEEDPGDGSLIRAALNDIARAQKLQRAGPRHRYDSRRVIQGVVRKRQPIFRYYRQDYPRAGNAAEHHDNAVGANNYSPLHGFRLSPE